MDSIDEHLCSGCMGECAEITDGIDGAGEVGGGAKCNQTGFASKLALKVVNIKSAVVGMNGNFADVDAYVAGGELPWRKISIVIEAGDKNVIAGLPCLSQCPAEGEGQRGHVCAEANRVRIVRAEKIHSGLVRAFKHLVALVTGGKFAFVIGIAVRKIIPNGINDALRNLAARRAIEECHGLAVDFA